jgi:DNA gyrase subunit A
MTEYESIRQNGKIAISLREGDELLNVKIVKEDTICGNAASNGKMCNFLASEARPMGRTASGVKGIELDDGDYAVGCTTSLEGKYILVITDKGYGKLSDAETYRKTKRGAKGVATLKATDKVGQLVDVRAVIGDEDLMVITKAGVVIRTPIEQIRIAGRNTQGVKIINPEARQKVSSIAIVPHEEEIPEEEQLEEGEAPVENIENSEE